MRILLVEDDEMLADALTRALVQSAHAVDASDQAKTSAALAEAARLYALEPIDVHVLSVQPGVSGHVAMFFDDRELHELQQAAGADELAPAVAWLMSQQVPATSSVRIGRRAETIAVVARERGCDRIVLGRDGERGNLASRVFGSLAHQVRESMRGGCACQVIGA